MHTTHRLCWLVAIAAGALGAQENPFNRVAAESFRGRFASAKGEVVLRKVGERYEGTASFLGQTLPLVGRLHEGVLRGLVGTEGEEFEFACELSPPEGIAFKAGTFSDTLKRVPKPDLVGFWTDGKVNLSLSAARGSYTGTLQLNGQDFQLQAQQDEVGEATGSFESGGQRFEFSLSPEGDRLRFATGAFKTVLARGSEAARVDPGYASAVEQAKQLGGFRYLDTKRFECGGNAFELARFQHAPTGLTFHLIPGGSYDRGSESGDSDEKPVARVSVRPFLLCATECTQSAWRNIKGDDPSRFKGAQRPVELVSWEDAQSFCRKAGLRLPSEAEWEYACRGGSAGGYCYGDGEGDLGRYAVYGGSNAGVSETQAVGGKLPNAFGLYDVHGNVWEWCEDAYADGYQGAPVDGSARAAGASRRVYRGGGWYLLRGLLPVSLPRQGEPGSRLNRGLPPRQVVTLGPLFLSYICAA
ncbi:MAG: formylglycine-generating enzyme family protein [Planctomycetota bacterium]